MFQRSYTMLPTSFCCASSHLAVKPHIMAAGGAAAARKPAAAAAPRAQQSLVGDATTVRVQFGKEQHKISLPTGSTIGDLKQRLKDVCPAHEACLMAKGKKLADDSSPLGSIDKLMLLRRPGAGGSAKKLTVTLRCLTTGRVARGVEVSATSPISHILESVASKALKLPSGHGHELFVEKGKMLLRSDLSLADYATSVSDGTELFVCQSQPSAAGGAAAPFRLPKSLVEVMPPQPTATAAPAAPAATSNKPAAGAAAAVASPAPSAAPAAPPVFAPASFINAMAASLPAAERQAFEALVANAPAEELRAADAMAKDLDAEISRLLGVSPATTAAAAGTSPPQAAGAAAAAAAAGSAPSLAEGASTASAGGAAAAAAAGAVPRQMASGLLPNARMQAGPRGTPMLVPMAMANMPKELREDLERTLSSSLPAGVRLGDIQNIEQLLGDASKNLAAGARPELFGSAMPLGGGMGGGAEEAHRARLEETCSKLVDTLRPDEKSASPEVTAAAAKEEKKGWGKGLSKGFLNKPKRKRRAAPAEAVAAAAAPAASEAAVATSSCAPVAMDVCSAVCSEGKEGGLVSVNPATGEVMFAAPTAPTSPPSGPAATPPAAKKAAGAASERPRCSVCVARLPITATQAPCRCGGLYCAAHMHCHECQFDYKTSARSRLRESNPEIVPRKLESSI